MGGSSGINVAGAIRLAKDMGPGHVIVTILADYGTRYQSKLFNPKFLRERRFPVPEWLERHSNSRCLINKADRCQEIRVEPMLTDCLFREDAYLKECSATVAGLTDAGGIVLDRTIFYAASGGQPGDCGVLRTAAGDTSHRSRGELHRCEKSDIAHVPVAPRRSTLKTAEPVHASIDWDLAMPACACTPRCICSRRCCHIPVTGGAVGDRDGRLDFDIPEAGLDKEEITASWPK